MRATGVAGASYFLRALLPLQYAGWSIERGLYGPPRLVSRCVVDAAGNSCLLRSVFFNSDQRPSCYAIRRDTTRAAQCGDDFPRNGVDLLIDSEDRFPYVASEASDASMLRRTESGIGRQDSGPDDGTSERRAPICLKRS